jgi:hypothetical protein
MTDGGGIRRFTSPRGPRGSKGYGDDAVLSDDEVLRRVDLREAAHPDQPSDVAWIGAPSADGAPAESQLLEAVDHRDIGDAGVMPVGAVATSAVATSAVAADAVRRSGVGPDDRRRLLWRDTATILIAVVLALLAGQVFLPQQTAGPAGSATPFPSAIAVGSVGPPVTLPPGATFGPILNPSLGVDATPTPIPVITLGPTPTASPSIEPSSSVSPSVKPSVKPSAKPTPKPTPRPTRTPTPTAAPPIAGFNRSASTVNIGESVDFTDTSTGSIDSWFWDFGDGDTSTAQNPSHAFLVPCGTDGVCTVRLTVTGPGGSDFAEHPVTVVTPLPTP